MTTRPESGPPGGGIRLRELIQRYGALGPEPALVVLREYLAAARERGAYHRDYRPEDVLLDRDGASRLTGFGGPAAAGSQAPSGPDPYQAPELRSLLPHDCLKSHLRYGAPVSWASSAYAATAVFFECLTGWVPSPEQTRRFDWQRLAAPGPAGETAGSLHDLVAWGMAADPADRPDSARQFIAELDHLAAAGYGPPTLLRCWPTSARAAARLPLSCTPSPGHR